MQESSVGTMCFRYRLNKNTGGNSCSFFSQENDLFEAYWDWEGIDAIDTMENTLSE